MTLLCRPMKASDIPAIAAIEATVADGWSAEGIALALAAPAVHAFVACEDNEDGALVGFACFSVVVDQANLDALSVSQSARRKGYAKTLLAYTFSCLVALGAKECFLEVRSQNIPALALYKSLGFSSCGLRRNFYRTPEDDAVVMHRVLF